MKILFDFISYQVSAKRGVGRYILAMYEHMIKIGGFDSYILVSNKYPIELPESVIQSGQIYVLESWDNYDIDTTFDFFFRGDFFPPNVDIDTAYPATIIKCCRQIVGIMHDLIPLVFAKNYLSDEKFRLYYAKMLTKLGLASHLFSNSPYTRQDCVKLINFSSQDITTAYAGVDEQKFTTKNSNKKYDKETRTNNLICVPGDDLRKNYTGAVRGFCLAYTSGKIPKDSKLYLVCNASDTFKSNVNIALKNFPTVKLDKQIVITGFLPDAVMVDLLSFARASIFPSFYEGLGLPILESYFSGTPVIGSNLSSTKDLLLSACSFNPYNDEEIANAITDIYNDDKLCQKSLDFGRKIIAEKYNWDNSANIVIKKLKELSKQNKKIKKVAVFSCLPPQASGIALFTYNTHSVRPDLYDMFSNIESLRDYQNLLCDDVNMSFYGKDLSTKETDVRDGMALSFHDFKEKKLASFGPYITLPNGNYDLILDYKASKDADIDFKITADNGKIELLNGVLNAKQESATIHLNLDKQYSDLECVLYFAGESFVIKKMSFVQENKNKKIDNVFPYDLYPYACLHRDYIGKIFVFGNSPHHGVSLDEAIKTRGEKNRFAYLHEALIMGAFTSKFPDLKAFLKTWYPFISDELDSGDIYEVMRKNDLCGIRPLIEMTGIRNFIVNNETAKSLIMAEIKRLNLGKCNVHVLFLPIPDLSHIKKDKSLNFGDADLVVGSFGMPNASKRAADVICAVNELNNAGHKIKLLLAGYDATNCVKGMNLDLSNTILFDNPSDEDLLKFMKSVDIAIQLRKNPHGESSGCIAQLLGMGQNLITQNGFVPTDCKKFCTLVPQSASVEEISNAILMAMKNKNKTMTKTLIKQYSFEELAKKLYDLAVKK